MRGLATGMVRVAAGLTVLALAGACAAPSTGAGSTRPSPAAAASTFPPPSPGATAAPAGTPSSVAACTGAIPSGGNLVLATVTGSSTVVLRDITNLASAHTICTFAGSVSPRFATASVVGYMQGGDASTPGKIVRLDLASATSTDAASWPSGGSGSGFFDWSPDGRSLTYIGGSSTGTAWHLVSGGHDLVLATLPAVPGRGVSPQDDDFMLSFSPDGLYVALVQTFAIGGAGETAPVQVRRTSDGGLVYSATSGTMGVWASLPSRLFFRDRGGILSRWDPSSGVSVMQSSLRWTRPHSSPDGRWVAYTTYDGAGHPHVALYSVQGNSVGPSLSGIRSGAQFLNNSLVWYREEAACDCGLIQSQPTGKAYLYDIGASTENASRISALLDAWPRVTAPPGLAA